jgi:streptogrisin C
VWIRAAFCVWWAGSAALAQAPPPVIETAADALAQDAREYSARFRVPFEEALRQLAAQEASVPATDALASQYRDRLAGIVIEHEGGYRITLLLTGDEPVADTVIPAGALTIPVHVQTGARATREQILDAIASHQADIRAALQSPPGMGVDARTGSLVIMVKPSDIPRGGASALADHFGAMTGVPVEIRTFATFDTNLAAEAGGRVAGVLASGGHRGLCTSGFFVTDGTQIGLTTAAHCPDLLDYLDPGGGGAIPLPLIGAWGARYQDVQIHAAPLAAAAPAPLFYSDTAKTRLRPVTSWRNRTSTRVGDFVCHRGERSGYSCAEVEFVDYAPPGDLCAGPCPATWVAVRGPTCRGGDSGGPVFSGSVAFGFVKGASYTDDGTCRLFYYMSVDYLPPGWTVLHVQE